MQKVTSLSELCIEKKVYGYKIGTTIKLADVCVRSFACLSGLRLGPGAGWTRGRGDRVQMSRLFRRCHLEQNHAAGLAGVHFQT